jgi:probable HAF family extracellular repeat protein
MSDIQVALKGIGLRVPLLVAVITICAAMAAAPRLPAQETGPEGKPAQHYVVTDLPTLGGNASALAGGLNNRGWVNGAYYLSGNTTQHAFLWRDGETMDLGTLGGPNSSASFPLNEQGQVAGGSEISTPDPNGESFCAAYLGFPADNLICLPFIWEKGVMTALPTLGGNNGNANQINNRGQIAGNTENTTFDPTCLAPALEQKPVVWRNGTIEQELPIPSGDTDGIAIGINDLGEVVGSSGICGSINLHGLLWQSGLFTDLGSLGGSLVTLPQSINNRGQVVGFSDLAGDTTTHGFFWQKGVMTDLGTLAGDFFSFAFSINEKDQVVGQSCDISFNCRAVLWENGGITDLNTLIPADSPLYLLIAFSNNSRGQIEGIALETSTGELHDFLATPQDGKEDSAAFSLEGAISEKPKVVLPENVRKLLQQRRGGRLGVGLMEAQ